MVPYSKIYQRPALRACGASRLRRQESEQSHRVVVLEGLACGVVRWRSGMLSAIKKTMLVSVHAYIWRYLGALPPNPALPRAKPSAPSAGVRPGALALADSWIAPNL